MSWWRRILLFGVAGVVGFLVDVGALYLTAPWLGWYSGRVASFLAAASATWQINRRWAFGDAKADRRQGWKPYLRYLTSMLGGAVVNYALYVAVLQIWDSPHAPWAGVAAGSIGGLGFNFLAARFFIFGRPTA